MAEVAENPATETTMNNQDPFASQREGGDNPFEKQEGSDPNASPPDSAGLDKDQSTSREWDASKVPPSQFQKRKGSIYATPSSRDGHTDKGKARDKSFHDKLKEKGWIK